MAKQVTNKDIFAENVFKKTQEDVVLLISELDSLETKILGIAKAQQKILNKEDNKTIQSIQRTRQATTKLGEAQKLNNDVQKEKIRLENNISKSRKKSKLENEQLKVILSEQNKVNKQLAREKLNLVGAYEKESKKLTTLRKKYKDLALSEGVTTEKSKALLVQIQKLDTKLKQIDRTVGQSQRNVGNYGKAWGRVGGIFRSGLGILGITAGIAIIGNALRGAVKTIREFDEAVADLQKVTGLAKAEARDLAKEISQIDTRTSIKSLLELATAGGRLGLTGAKLVSFTKSTDKAFVALGDSLSGTAEEIGLSLGKIASNFGIEREFGIGVAIDKIGSSLNDLGAKSKATEGKILDFTTRLSGVASQAGIIVPDIQALGALFDEAGVSSEVASSVIAKLLPAIGKDVKKFAKVAGVDVKEFSKLLADKPIEALIKVSKGAQSSQKGLEGLNKTLENFGIKGGRGAAVVGILAGKQERLNELMEISNEAFEKATSLSDEFAIKNETVSATTEKMANTWDRFVLSIENGSGSISKGLGSLLGLVDKLLVGLTRLNESAKELAKTDLDNINKGIGDEVQKRTTIAIQEFRKSSQEEIDLIKKAGFAKENEANRIAKINAKTQAFEKRARNETIQGEIDKEEFVQAKILRETEFSELSIKNANKFAQTSFRAGLGLEFAKEKALRQDATSLSIATDRIAKLKLMLIEEKKVVEVQSNDVALEVDNKKIKAKRTLVGLIEKQAKVVSDLQIELKRATSEEEIFSISFEIKFEKEELERLKRIASSTREEFEKQQVNLIEDGTERQIAKLKERHDKLIKLIQTNSKTTTEEKKRLEAEAEREFDDKATDLQIRKGQRAIKADADLSRATFEQRKRGFKTEKAFEEEKEAQFNAIRRNAIDAEIELLEVAGQEKDQLKIEQLKAEREGLYDLGKEAEKVAIDFGAILEVIADEVDKQFEKRLEQIDELVEKTGERIDDLKKKATEGSLAADESLAFERKKEIELEKEREQTRKRQEQAKAFFSVMTAFNNNDGNIGKTVADVAVLKALAGQLTAYDGVDDTGGRGNIDSKGGKLWTLHPNEQVWSKADRGDVGFRSRDELKNIVGLYDKGMMNDLKTNDASNGITPLSLKLNGLGANSDVVNKLNTLNQSIQNIDIPEGMVNIDQVRKLITLTSIKGNKKTKEISKLFDR